MTTFGRQVQSLRQARGLTQAALARKLDISRQALIAIETDRTRPHLDLAVRLGLVLGVTLDELTAPLRNAPDLADPVWLDGSPPPASTPVVRAVIRGRQILAPVWTAAGSVEADAWWDADTASLISAADSRDPARTVFVAGCDPYLPQLKAAFDALNAPWRMVIFSRSSQSALAALARGTVHLAGTHLFDPKTGGYNRRPLAFDLCLTGYLHWQEGLVGAGTPGSAGAYWALREPGSEAYALWRRHHPTSPDEREPVQTFPSHTALIDHLSRHRQARGVSLGSLANLQGLAFEPWAEEVYEWAARADDQDTVWFRAFQHTLAASSLARHLTRMAYQSAPEWGQVRRLPGRPPDPA